MASLLSHKSIVEICTFIPRNGYASLPNKEWVFTARHCVNGGGWCPDFPPDYFSSDSFRMAVGKHSLAESLDIVFSPGQPLLLWQEVPKGLVEGIVQRYQTACKQSVAMRHVTLNGVDITNVWTNAYFTSFPCRRCSSRDNTVVEREDEHETRSILVFHLTPPEANQCLSIKYSTSYRRVEVVSCKSDCVDSSVSTPQSQRERSTLRVAVIRHVAFRYLPRADLDTCLIVNRHWNAEVKKFSGRFALRKLTRLEIICDHATETRSFCFIVSCHEVDSRSFVLPRNAAIDSAVALNHLRNCTAPADGFGIDFSRRTADDSVALWISGLLRSAENFRFAKLDMSLEWTDATDVVIHFMRSTRDALLSSTHANGLCDVGLQIDHSALQRLVEERFLQWPYLQNVAHIHLEMRIFTPVPPGEPTWISGLFQLPKCKSIVVEYLADDADCSAHVLIVLRETMALFESAADVSGFPEEVQFVLRQEYLTWEHQEPTPTHSNVLVPGHSGPWNVYATKNIATDVPLSVFVNTEENSQGDDVNDEGRLFFRKGRRFMFRKEYFNMPFVKASRKRRLD